MSVRLVWLSSVLLLTLPAAGSAPFTRIIVPGNVVVSSYAVPGPKAPFKTGRGLNGSFWVERSSAPRAIASEGMGGACLIADLRPFGIPSLATCRTDEQCTGSLGVARQTAGWSSYCVVERDRITADGKTPPGRCWTRPGPPDRYCTMAKTAPWPDKIPVSVPETGVAPLYSPWKSGADVRWRVRACLNGVDGAAGKPPCRGNPGSALKVDGPALMVPK